MKLINELKDRGMLNNITNIDKFNSLKKGDGVYIGFDPTAISLHLGNYVQIRILKLFQKHGFSPIAVLGGATGMIGDPSGRSTERNLLGIKEIQDNQKAINKQFKSFGLNVVNNKDFYKNMNILDFLRDVGKLLNINYMLNKDVVKSRLDKGISFTEFSYQLIQGWDFKNLYENHNVAIQVGGSDQWGNITSGIEIIRKTIGDKNSAVGITTNLLTDSEGNKFGKSTGGALWLDETLTKPYEMYQYLLNFSDEDVEKLLLWLTSISVLEIKKIMHKHNKETNLRYAQKTLAFSVVEDIHGTKNAQSAINISEVLFGKKNISDLTNEEMKALDGIIPVRNSNSKVLLELLINTKICSSKREARELISGNAIEIMGKKVTDPSFKIINKNCIIKRGKKQYFFIKFN